MKKLTLFLACVASAALAQDTAGVGSIQGVVKNAAGQPAFGTTVCVSGSTKCAVSDDDGRFQITELRAGQYTLTVTSMVSAMVDVRAGLVSQVEVLLPNLAAQAQSITVSESVFVAPEEIKTSNFLVSSREISKTAGSLQDVSRFVQTLPGVAIGSNDFRNDIIVRGGSPLENLFVVDNIEIPNINNFANFASAGGTVGLLDAELIRDVNFLTGGYPSQFINRTSGVLQIAQREGDRERFRGRATLGFAGAGTILEGPLGRASKGSWVVSARRSFLDAFTKDIGLGGVPKNYSFNAKALYDLTPKDRIWAVNFTGIDSIRLGPTKDDLKETEGDLATLDIRYEGWRSANGFSWQRLIGDRGVGLLGVSHSESKVKQSVKDLFRFGTTGANVDDLIARSPVVYGEDSRESESTVKYDLTVYAPVLNKVQVGGSQKIFRIQYDAAQPLGFDSPYTLQRDTDVFAVKRNFLAYQTGGYVQTTQNLTKRLNLTWGGRMDYYQFIGSTVFSPRAAASYRLTEKLSFRASYGRYFQQPFFLFLSAFPVNKGLAPIRSTHYVTGLSYVFDGTLRMTLEGYQKDYSAYPVAIAYPSLSLANTGDTFAVRSLLFPMTSAGRGRVRGLELFVEKRFSQKWFGQANISFSKTRHAGLDQVLRPGSFDYPRIFNAVGGYKLNPKWEFSARLSYLSGRPYTPFQLAASTQQRRGIFDLNRVNAERLPDYFRLDIRADRQFTFRGKPVLVFIGVQNAINRKNIASVSWDRRLNTVRENEQLGLFPLIGLDWRF